MEGEHLTIARLGHRFNYHQPNTEAKIERHQRVRRACLEAADELVEATGPPTREQSLAIGKLEEAMFWANAAIAREVSPNG